MWWGRGWILCRRLPVGPSEGEGQGEGRRLHVIFLCLPPRVLRPVRVVKAIAPEPKASSPSPLKVPVITLPATQQGSPEGAQKSPGSQPHNGVASPVPQVSSSPAHTLTNGPTVPSSSPPSTSHAPPSPSPNCFKTPKVMTPRTPLSSEAALNPSDYKYVVEPVAEGLGKMLVASKQLR